MTVFNVQMLAHNPSDWLNPRPVDVPENEISENVEEILERIFFWGQNDFQPISRCCSVSVGDVAEVNGKFWICKPVGWREISPEDLKKYKALDRRDRLFSCYIDEVEGEKS